MFVQAGEIGNLVPACRAISMSNESSFAWTIRRLFFDRLSFWSPAARLLEENRALFASRDGAAIVTFRPSGKSPLRYLS